MKKLILILMILIAVPGIAKEKEHLPFANKAKYGKYRTKQCKPVKRKQAWIYRQWGRN